MEEVEVTAMICSVPEMVRNNGIDVLRRLTAWLTACAENGGKPPDDQYHVAVVDE